MGTRWKDRELHWREVVDQQAASGLSVATFCRQQSLSAPSFYSWKRKLTERNSPPDRQNAISAKPIDRAQLVPVRIEPRPTTPIRILLPHGVSVEMSGEIGEGTLTSLLRAVREVH